MYDVFAPPLFPWIYLDKIAAKEDYNELEFRE